MRAKSDAITDGAAVGVLDRADRAVGRTAASFDPFRLDPPFFQKFGIFINFQPFSSPIRNADVGTVAAPSVSRQHVVFRIPTEMPLPERLTYDDALAHLCSKTWATENVGTRLHEDTLKALLPASRTEQGRIALGGVPNAIENITVVLNDPAIFYNDVGVLAVRLLRNLCARSPDNQKRAADAEVHLRVLDSIKTRLELFDKDMNADATRSAALRRVEESTLDGDHMRLRMPFFGFAVELLVNFVTCNPENADKVWKEAFPVIFGKLLECDNHAAASAAAALVHNCIAVLPERITDIVKIWGNSEGQGKSLTQSILAQVRPADDESPEQFEKFSWAFLVIKRLVEADQFRQAFVALGPPLNQILTGADTDFSPDQETLVNVLEAAICKSAERPSQEVSSDVRVPEDSLPFLCELMEIARLKRNGTLLRLTLSISGSVIVMCNESPKLTELKMTTTKVAVETLKMVAKQEKEGGRRPSSLESHGLRAGAIRAIALACDRYRAAQDHVRNLDGLVLVLGSLSYEKDPSVNPFLREWAIIAVRNLCLDNKENSEDISSYELQGVSQDEEFMERTGLEAYVDETSGQSRVRMRQTS